MDGAAPRGPVPPGDVDRPPTVEPPGTEHGDEHGDAAAAELQPGLEWIGHDPDTLSGKHFIHSSPGYDSQKELFSRQNIEHCARPRRTFSLLFTVGIAVAVGIIAGLIGGIAGWKVIEAKYDSRSPGSPPSNTTGTGPAPANSTSGAAQLVRPDTQLAATGRWFGSDFVITLFYQDPNNLLHYSVYDTRFSSWSRPEEINGSATAATSTPMAAGISMWEDRGVSNSLLKLHIRENVPIETNMPYSKPDPSPQLQLYFITPDGITVGQNWRDGDDASGTQDGLWEDLGDPVDHSTRLAVYWPYIVTQSTDGNSLQQYFYNYTLDLPWQSPQYILGVTATPGCGILALPLKPSQDGLELRILYPDTKGRLNAMDRNADGELVTVAGASNGILPFQIPTAAPLAGFATAGSIDAMKRTCCGTTLGASTNSTNGTISWGYQDLSGSWRGPFTDGAFRNADRNTSLACVTAARTSNAPGAVTPMPVDARMNRCYFLEGGAVKEVWYDGNQWNDLGFVYMPASS